jgi:hypothetical protein
MGSENAHKCTQNTENGFSFDCLERYHKYGDEFLNHILTGDDTWVSFVNVEPKEQSKELNAHTFTKQAKKFKQILSARILMAAVFWDRKGVLIV